MKKKMLTEEQLHKIIKESVKSIIVEMNNNYYYGVPEYDPYHGYASLSFHNGQFNTTAYYNGKKFFGAQLPQEMQQKLVACYNNAVNQRSQQNQRQQVTPQQKSIKELIAQCNRNPRSLKPSEWEDLISARAVDYKMAMKYGYYPEYRGDGRTGQRIY